MAETRTSTLLAFYGDHLIKNATPPTAMVGEVAFVARRVLLGLPVIDDDPRVLAAVVDDDNLLLPVIADSRLGFPGMHDDPRVLAAAVDHDRLLLPVILDAPANFATLAFLFSFYLFFDRTRRRETDFPGDGLGLRFGSE
jgi:hypothetical protein